MDTDFQAAYEAGRIAITTPFYVHLDGVPGMLVPPGCSVKIIEDMLPSPLRRRATPRFEEAGSFARYVEEFKGPASRLFAATTAGGGEFCCLLDYHEPGANGTASWVTHTARYSTPFSEEWKLLKSKDGQWMPQREFAEFIESNTAHVVTPAPVALLEVAQIDFQSTTESKAGEKGNMEIPAAFELGLPVFNAGAPYRVKARLRNRITDAKKLELRYELLNTALIIRAAWNDTMVTVGEATRLEVFQGTP